MKPTPETQPVTVEPPKDASTPEVKVLDVENGTKGEGTAEVRAETLSPSAEEVDVAESERMERQRNNDDLLKWLTESNIETLDPELFQLFKNALKEKSPDDAQIDQNLDQVALLLKELPTIFESFDKKIEELGKDETKYKKIKEKRNEILRGFCESVVNGHLTAEDVCTLVKDINVYSRDNPPEEEREGIKRMLAASGYDVVLCFDPKTKQMTIFEETLTDGKENERLDFKHMVNHEMSHSIVEARMIMNETLTDQAVEIIKGVGELKNSLSEHTRTALRALDNIDRDFDKFFAIKIRKNPDYESLPDPKKEEYKTAEKARFERDRKNILVHEILSEYTAIYLESDGSLDGFVSECIKKNGIKDPKLVEQAFGIKVEELKAINKADPDKRSALIDRAKKDSPEKFAKIVELYLNFYREIRNEIQTNKGKFSGLAVRGEDDYDFDLSEYGGGYGEPAGSFNTPSGNQGGNSGEGFWKEFVGFMAAFGEEVGGKSIPS